MIDTHTHLYDEAFDADREEMLARAVAAGATHLVLPNVDLASMDTLHQMCDQHPTLCYPAMGLHPTEVGEGYKEVLAQLKQQLDNRDYCAIGEIGIDLYWEQSTLPMQQDAFAQQIEWALAYELPIIVHMRDAYVQTYEVVKQYQHRHLHGVFHSFNGTPQQVEEILALGDYYFGINGVVTFKSVDMSEALRTMGLDRVVLETDAPYLTPVPYRGKRNEPAYLTHIIEKLSKVFDLPTAVIQEKTTQNALKLFPKLPPLS